MRRCKRMQTRLLNQQATWPRDRAVIQPAFAEYTEPVLPRDGVTDTGLSMRAFLPSDPQSGREVTVGYSGTAALLDTRVACMRPAFSDINIQAFVFESWIAGSVWREETVPRLNTSTGMNGRVKPSPFNCSFSFPSVLGATLDVAASEWTISICNVPFADEFGDRDTGLVSEMLPIPRSPTPNPFRVPCILSSTSLVHSPTGGKSITQEVSFKSMKWSMIRVNGSQTDVSGLSYGMTLCTFALEVQDTNITATRPHGAAEAAASWIASSSMYDTRAIRAQLGGTNPILPRVERGIFKLAKRDSWLECDDINDTLGESSPLPPADINQIRSTAFSDLPGGVRRASAGRFRNRAGSNAANIIEVLRSRPGNGGTASGAHGVRDNVVFAPRGRWPPGRLLGGDCTRLGPGDRWLAGGGEYGD
ncbi:hypothetical protein EDB81DRAFT_932028 [Dactylonectria macrodidyma]|uniref:Uncharacterized protein n=1 Tax=Dactylonectria macrodidyma TaxID=307937 RepID=A0A9P9F611_9HYPO|nr:hypothetical protein EDB81DRAFT_932028 [Dactylonectria macrodidyma]